MHHVMRSCIQHFKSLYQEQFQQSLIGATAEVGGDANRWRTSPGRWSSWTVPGARCSAAGLPASWPPLLTLATTPGSGPSSLAASTTRYLPLSSLHQAPKFAFHKLSTFCSNFRSVCQSATIACFNMELFRDVNIQMCACCGDFADGASPSGACRQEIKKQ